jgi:hypothetical protein
MMWMMIRHIYPKFEIDALRNTEVKKKKSHLSIFQVSKEKFSIF